MDISLKCLHVLGVPREISSYLGKTMGTPFFLSFFLCIFFTLGVGKRVERMEGTRGRGKKREEGQFNVIIHCYWQKCSNTVVRAECILFIQKSLNKVPREE